MGNQKNPTEIVISSDDLLLEILVRLPHAKDAIRCSAVCKRWHSLISDTSFINQYKNHHRRSPLPYTLLVEFDNGYDYYCPLFSEESEALHSNPVSFSHLDFVNTPGYDIALLGTSDGLLYFIDEYKDSYLICDPVTRRCAQIPDAPSWGPHWGEHYGLACDHRRGCFAFVVMLGGFDHRSLHLGIFRSDYGTWDVYSMAYPRESVTASHYFSPKSSVTTENGVMHFQLSAKSGFLAFRPMSDERETKVGTFIGMPCGFDTTEQYVESDNFFGLFRGRLRLVQFAHVNRSFTLKIWELRYDDDNDMGSASWVVVYDGALRKLLGGIDLCVKALHPSKGSVVLVMHDCEVVYEYDFEQGEYTLVDSIPYELNEEEEEEEEEGRKYIDMNTYTIAHPSWPFPILYAISTDVTANDLL